jgi:hypothetical protein
MNLTTSFRELYERHWEELIPCLSDHQDLSSPLLVDPPDAYVRQAMKLFIVGQETATWYNHVVRSGDMNEAIPRLMTLYKDCFQMGLKKPRSKFWQFVRKLEARLGIEPGAVVWSNVNKVDQKGKKPRMAIRVAVRHRFPVLAEEIRLAAPDVVVFLTGRTYDSYLARVFPGAQFKPVSDLGHMDRIVDGRGLPDRSFRTGHPRGLQSNELEGEVLAALAAACQ